MKTMTLELPDEVYESIMRKAEADRQPPSAWVAARVPALLPARQVRPVLTPEQREVALAQLLQHAGAVSSGDPDSANNARIDAELAAEYASTHEEPV